MPILFMSGWAYSLKWTAKDRFFRNPSGKFYLFLLLGPFLQLAVKGTFS